MTRAVFGEDEEKSLGEFGGQEDQRQRHQLGVNKFGDT